MAVSLRDQILAEARERATPQRQNEAPESSPPATATPRPARQLPPEDLLSDTVLGACLASTDYLADAAARLVVDDWPFGWQRVVWRAMLGLRERGQGVTLMSLLPRLDAYLCRLVARACAERQNPYGHDYVGDLALIGEARRSMEAALAQACREMEVRR